jgi:hypothetical protein
LSLKEEWQLVAHSALLSLTPAEGAVAQAIARRIRPNSPSEELPFRTIYAESVGVTSKATVQRALEKLASLGVIRIPKTAPGSRSPRVITWLFECPAECELDHANGNRRLKTTRLERELEALADKTPESNTPTGLGHDTPHSVGHLKKENKEREGILSFIEKALSEAGQLDPNQRELKEALKSPEKREAIRAKAELMAIKAQDVRAYLSAIATNSPEKLLPRALPKQAPPDYSHLPREIRELQLKADAMRAANQ